ncbi:unnamed protein product [Caenorhabditis angaria]|uniref:Protein amnionless n=1 Tax=Caenorhabditis angaria TaxID=860376 RepID=A0A9P1N6Y0_9PELO|nr:unnamed protein product [Caenorhabditis angaria]
MNYFFSRAILLLVIGFGAAPINALDYIFKQRNFLTNKENWLQGLIPSKHDIVEFDSTAGYAVVYIDQVLEASEIRLPDNGLIIFNDPVALGDRETWQSGDDFSETVRFQPPLPPSFFDPISWQESEKVFLHMNKVPSKKDKVIFPEEGVAQVELDARAYVNRFEYYGRVSLGQKI